MKDSGRDCDLLAILVLILLLGVMQIPRPRSARFMPDVTTLAWEVPSVRR